MAIDTSLTVSEAIDELEYTVAVSDSLSTPDWTTIKGLDCVRVRGNVGSSGHDTAQLVHDYSWKTTLEDGTAFSGKLSLAENFVRITIGSPAVVTWYGYILDESRGKAPVETRNTGTPSEPEQDYVETEGQQFFPCVGLTWFLDRATIDEAVHFPQTGSATPNRIRRPRIFNGGTGGQFDIDFTSRGNQAVNDSGSKPVFEEPSNSSDGGAKVWTAAEIVRYLFEWFEPEKSGNPHPVQWTLDASIAAFTTNVTPVLKTDRLTVFKALNALMNPSRGFVWWAEYNGTDAIVVKCQPINKVQLDLPGGVSIPANTDQHEWDFDSDNHVNTPIIDSRYSHKYRTVRARGGYRTAIGTLSIPASTLEPDWDDTTSGESGKYRVGVKGVTTTPAYNDLTKDEKAKRNDAFRLTDQFFHVYNAFRIDSQWDGKTNDGSEDGPKDWCCPSIFWSTGGAQIIQDESATFSLAGTRVLNHLPLLVGYDYKADPANPEQKTISRRPSYRKPFALFPLNEEETRFQYADKLGHSGSEKSEHENLPACNLITQDQYPGIYLKPSGLNHAIAKNHVDNPPGFVEPSQQKPELDYDTMRVTVCLEFDEYAEYTYPPGLDREALDELPLDLGSRYRHDWIAANTIIDIDDKGELIQVDQAGALRDDLEELGKIAAAAYGWYETPRKSLSVVIEKVYGASQFRLGRMITKIGTAQAQGIYQEEINTVITAITYQLSGDQKMTVETQAAELDFNSIL